MKNKHSESLTKTKRGRPCKQMLAARDMGLYERRSTSLAVRVDASMRSWVEQYAAEYGITLSQVITLALVRLREEWLREQELQNSAKEK